MSARTLPHGLPRSTRLTRKTSEGFSTGSRGLFKSIARSSNSAKYSKHGGKPLENYVNLSSTASFELREALLVYRDRKSTRLNSSHLGISYAVFCSPRDLHSSPTRRSSDLFEARRETVGKLRQSQFHGQLRAA